MNKKENLQAWMRKADKIASYSKDQSTKVGAIFVDKNNISPITWGYNGMPRGLPDDDIKKNERPEKYLWGEHAERNAIYNLAQQSLTNTIILTTQFPNMESARAIVSVGIKKVIVSKIMTDDESLKVRELFNLTKVQLVELDSLSKNEKRNKIKGFMELCDEYAEDFGFENNFIKKSACMILNPYTYSYITMGENGPPSLMSVPTDITEENSSFWVQEAEKNAIFNLMRPKLEGSTGYVSWCPCAHCSLAVTSVGVKKVVSKKIDFTKEADLRWKDHFLHSEKTLKNHGVELELV